jgi:Zn-dependent protease with chaperone function
MTRGNGIYFDGITSARHDVAVELTPETLLILDGGGLPLTEWPYSDVEQLAATKHILRLGLRGEPVLARLEVHDADFAAAIDERALTVDRSDAAVRRARAKVVGWSVLATVSLVLVAVFVVPNLAGRVAPLIPAGVERRLGAAVDAQVRASLDSRNLGERLECGTEPARQAGRAALDAMVSRLSAAAALPLPPTVAVLRRGEANAVALPGGHIYVYQGLLDKTESPAELAAVIAHEMGHVARRDGTRAMLQGAGLSLLFGMLLGDFVGGGAVVIAARTLIQSSYSRDVELAADAYGARLVAGLGVDPAALASILARIDGDQKPGGRLWLNHPYVAERQRAIAGIHAATAGTPLLDAGQWAALKRICAEP